jgi:FdhD protein
MTTSACGVCGKASTAELFVERSWDINEDHASVSAGWLASAPDALRAAQRVFASTGGLHAAGVFGADGELVVVREDVGRHNAVDKVVGWALRQGRLPLRGCVLLVSGRASFELAQKAVLAGFPVLAAVSAPSSLAVDLAAEAGLTLVGFLRGESMNVYTRADRIALPD